MESFSNLAKIILLIALILLVCLSAFFSSAETAYTSITKIQIERLKKIKPKKIKTISKHINSFGWTLSTILIGNTLVNIAASTLISLILSSYINAGDAAIIGTLTLTPVIVIFGELLPKIFAKKHPLGYLLKIAYLINILNILFMPFTFWMRNMVNKSSVTITEKDMHSVFDIAVSEGVIEYKESLLAKNALNFDSIKVKKAMHDREKVIFVNDNISKKKLIDVFIETGRSRIPVLNDKSKVIGVITLKDAMIWKTNNSLIDVMRKPFIVYDYEIISSVLEKMQRASEHLGIVYDENKNFIGIVTLEDIIEELVGEIYDETDSVGNISEIGLNIFSATGDSDVRNLFRHYLEMDIDVFKFKTITNWLKEETGKRIKKGFTYIYNEKIKFEVISNSRKNGVNLEITVKK
ncbi:MAG: hemolysin family protein [Mycoplasma sp.]|nr:hemolysin family protein [Mycoplasma sp.]